MKNIIAILKELGVDVPEGKDKELLDSVAKEYRTIKDYDNQKSKVETLQNEAKTKDDTIAQLKEQVESSSGDAQTIQKLQDTITKYEEDEQKRKAEQDEANKRKEFEPKFLEALGDRKFSNAIVEESIRAQAFEKKSNNPDMEVKSIIDDLTKDQEDVFANPNKPDPHNLPNPNGQDGGSLDIHTKDDVRKLSTAQINENWDQVQKILKL